MIRTFLCFIALISTFQCIAQDYLDLVRMSQTQTSGSARFEAMAGSFGALGSDLSCAAINPAGYGRFSSSTFGTSFQNTTIHNQTEFNGTFNENTLNSFKMNSLGVVLVSDVSERNHGFIFNQVGFSYNRIQNFKDYFQYSGQQFSSLLDQFCSNAYGYIPADLNLFFPFSTDLAWNTYAIDEDGNGGYVPRLTNSDVIHDRRVSNDGAINEFNLNLSTNYINKLYIGGNLGFRGAKYTEDYYHSEHSINTNGVTLDSFQYEYHLKTKGTGINLKLGAIYLPQENLRFGLSIHTNTFFQFTDDFSADMVAYHKDTTYRIDQLMKPTGNYKYRLRTPPKVIGSFAYVFGTRGCVNLDLEYLSYGWAHFRTTTDQAYAAYDYKIENAEAKQLLRSVINVRLGAELVFQSQYFIRAGLANYPSAYDKSSLEVQNTKKWKQNIQILSAGLGFKWKQNRLDLALKLDSRKIFYYAFPASLTAITAERTGIILNYSLAF